MRSGPKEVEPVKHKDVTYSAPHNLMGTVLAADAASQAELWRKRIYGVDYDFACETDVQDVYITSLAIQGDELVIQDESHREFRLNLESLQVLEVPTLMGRFRKLRQARSALTAENDPFAPPRVKGDPQQEARQAAQLQGELIAMLDQHPELEVPLNDRWSYYDEAGRSQEVCWILQPLLELSSNIPFSPEVYRKALARNAGSVTAEPSPYEEAARRELRGLESARLEGLRSLLRTLFQGLGAVKPDAATLKAFSDLLEEMKPLRAPLLVEARELGLDTRGVLDWEGYNLKSRGGMRRLVSGLRRWTVQVARLFP